MAFQDRHLQRVSFRGPVSGAYNYLTFVVPGTGLTIDPVFTWKASQACKIMEVSASTSAAASGTYAIATTAGTLLSARNVPNGAAEAVGPDPSAAANFTTDANRLMAKGDILTITLNHGATSYANVCVIVTVRVLDHVIKKATTNVGDDSSVESLD